jgi:hypothetical protein
MKTFLFIVLIIAFILHLATGFAFGVNSPQADLTGTHLSIFMVGYALATMIEEKK